MSALRAFLAEIVDYAGLFPPAKLELDEAIRNYATYRAQPEAWMLGRFIVPAVRLADLSVYHDELFGQGEPFTFSVLGRGGTGPGEWLENLAQDVAAISAFVDRHEGRALPQAMELKLPSTAQKDDDICNVADAAAARLDTDSPLALNPFYELTLVGDTWREQIDAAVCALSIHNVKRREAEQRSTTKAGRAGLKLRCGGVTPDAFPSVDVVAHALVACRETRVPLKATAGLHHPVRHFNQEAGATMHGFFNVFGAGVLAQAAGADASAIREIVEEKDAAAFRFDDDTFRWGEYRADAQQIAAARGEAVISFGSCSFDEPRDDLRALGLL